MKESKRVYIVVDYWTDKEKVYAIYIKNGKMYFMEQESKQ